MSEVHVEERSSLIKTPRQLIVVVLLAFLIPVIGIVMIANFVTGGLKVDSSSSDHSAAAVAERLKPVGSVVIGEVPAPAAGAQPAGATPAVKSTTGGAVKTAAAGGVGAGKKLYDAVCMVCHAAGIAGAPKTGDKTAWKPRIAAGKERAVAREVLDSQDRPLSRRDLFRRITRQAQGVAVRVWKDAAPEPALAARVPGRDHRRMAQAAAFFSTDTASRPLAAARLTGAGWTALAASVACTACDACARVCPTGALHLAQDAAHHFALRFTPLDCVGCEACLHVCAPAALSADHAPTFEQVFGGAPQTLCAGELARCQRCGALMAAHPGQTLCAVCAQRRLNPFGQHFPPGWRGAPRRPEPPR